MQTTTHDQEVILKKVKDFAEHAHGDQRRKYSGEKYVAHLHRVMSTCYLHMNKLSILSAALLHDVLEDTAVSSGEMKEFLYAVLPAQDADLTLVMVTELTDVYTKKNFPHLKRKERKHKEMERLATISADAQTIKYADIIDNSVDIVEHDPDFAIIFLAEYFELLREINKGDQVLYREAVKTVRDCLVRLN